MTDVPKIEFENVLGEIDIIKPEDAVIVVMGTTGAGKSSFIAECTGNPDTRVGYGLSSCTSRTSVHSTRMHGRTVHLIDTPGFDDSIKSDEQTFEELAYWLVAAYKRGVHLSGIIYLHRITDRRFSGSAQRALAIFKAMCGKDAFRGVVVATTMWDQVSVSETDKAWDRHKELETRFFADITAQGGRIEALTAVKRMAARIIGHISEKNRPLVMAFQEEFVDEERTLEETEAGRILLADLIKALKSKSTSERNIDKDATSIVNALRATRTEVQDIWREKLKEEDEALIREAQTYEDRLNSAKEGVKEARHVTFRLPESTPPTERTLSRREPLPVMLPEELSRQLESISFERRQRLSQKTYVAHGRTTTTLGVVGTGLAVGQLVAAIACNVM